MHQLDGNALAGVTSGLFAFDATSTPSECNACGDIAMIAEAVVYGAPMGYVVRCRRCGNILLVIVERGDERVLGMPGVRWLRVDIG